MHKHDAIAARLREASGADRELDADVYAAVTGADVWSYHDNCHIDAQIRDGTWTKPREAHPDFRPGGDDIVTWRWRIGLKYGEVPKLTSSVDAVIALIEAKLPECEWSIERHTADGRFYADIINQQDATLWSGIAATPALALLSALVAAIDEQETPNPGSPEAIGKGCTCARMDNAHGRGYLGRPGVFVITGNCPLHGTEES